MKRIKVEWLFQHGREAFSSKGKGRICLSRTGGKIESMTELRGER
jgi:hypothetical protein